MMKFEVKRVAVDFETEAIEGNALVTPPRPIGVAVQVEGREPTYHAGPPHVLGELLSGLWDNPQVGLVFHNAPFDLRVAEEWCSLPYPEWDRVHDTQFLLFLHNPHAKSFALKDSAAKILKMKTDERDELREWVMENVRGATSKTWGAHISKAPTPLVAKYAKMDAEMTMSLFLHLHKKYGECPAYDMERELQKYLTRATQVGVRTDVDALRHAEDMVENALARAEERIFLITGREFDVHNGHQLAEVLEEKGWMDEDKWSLTPTGKRSTARDVLMDALDHPGLLSLLSYAGAMRTCLTTFIRPWSQLAAGTQRLHPNWNQVRGEGHGARTGRMSSDRPNFQNIPNAFDITPPAGLPAIPNMRDFILPEPGDIWVSRDYAAQEIRLLAHFENGSLKDGFINDPFLDPHARVAELVSESTGVQISRSQAKTIAFGIIYGMGIRSLAKTLKVDLPYAMEMREAYYQTMPGVNSMILDLHIQGRYKPNRAEMKKILQRLGSKGYSDEHFARWRERKKVLELEIMQAKNNPVFTLAGRPLKPESPKRIKGQLRTFEYKLLNYLIQGSAADQTKLAMLRWFRNKAPNETFMAAVHDEMNISAPPGSTGVSLKQAMENDPLVSVPMVTTVKTGRSWGDIQ